jgi:non-ribosomal peptide synthetase component E (peptide arylation enzyme)
MCAYVILHPGQSLNLPELIAFLLAEEIAKHKLPERLEIVDELPLSPFGKVSKNILTEKITERLRSEGKI